METIVVGSLNTDLIATGILMFPQPGEHVTGKELIIGPGGKSRNIAGMIGRLSGPGNVAMVGRTVKDMYGLWKVPIDALQREGVKVDYVNVLESKSEHQLPGIAFIPVDQDGNNQIFVLPGVSNDFSIEDIDAAVELYNQAEMLVITSECPLDTAQYAVEKANQHGLKVLYDPGGLSAGTDVSGLIKAGVHVIKPNEHEARILTGVVVSNFASASKAAQQLQATGAKNVLITVGNKGAYLFTDSEKIHIPVPEISILSDVRDETGCGDQTLAALCVSLQNGYDIVHAAKTAVRAGTLQFYKLGIQPLNKDDLEIPQLDSQNR